MLPSVIKICFNGKSFPIDHKNLIDLENTAVKLNQL